MRLRHPSLLLAPVLLLAGCDLIGRPPLDDEFGDPYDIVVGAQVTGPGNLTTPAIDDAGELVVVLTYQGGCYEHHFGVQHAITDAVARVWILHEDFDDPCDDVKQQELTFNLSPAVLAQPTVELLVPGGASLALREPPDR